MHELRQYDTRPSGHAKGIASLWATVLLCLPSLAGASAMGINLMLYGDISRWPVIASALIALGVLIGAPSVVIAIVVVAFFGLSEGVSPRLKALHLALVAVAAIATLSLQLRFRM